ncbi:hypothetical protein [Mycolicibacterium vaccae]|uniref:Uncharacterized protein n=1 Tax=Mycolicibacterium vaccae ATCC 25954 TaxID=1194972 RepID=K0UKD1_MYCVA|nr:hypothetical protein [Mycolicibacterium vaccae]ANI37954.1 hypothetical protein MYVA_0697 [Mycolicibacterium vaccae 95051]EJZ07652.1 hypothetical protein MVAC_18355 [Mycolicibacterium vaccae ATCC 25954]
MTPDDQNQQRQPGDKPDVQLDHVTETPEPDDQERTEKPEVTDEHREKAKEMAKAYSDDLQTTTLPGSSGTVSGTSVTDWVDDEDKGKIETSAEEGKVEYRNTEEFKQKLEG